eukprot:UN18973
MILKMPFLKTDLNKLSSFYKSSKTFSPKLVLIVKGSDLWDFLSVFLDNYLRK